MYRFDYSRVLAGKFKPVNFDRKSLEKKNTWDFHTLVFCFIFFLGGNSMGKAAMAQQGEAGELLDKIIQSFFWGSPGLPGMDSKNGFDMF